MSVWQENLLLASTNLKFKSLWEKKNSAKEIKWRRRTIVWLHHTVGLSGIPNTCWFSMSRLLLAAESAVCCVQCHDTHMLAFIFWKGRVFDGVASVGLRKTWRLVNCWMFLRLDQSRMSSNVIFTPHPDVKMTVAAIFFYYLPAKRIIDKQKRLTFFFARDLYLIVFSFFLLYVQYLKLNPSSFDNSTVILPSSIRRRRDANSVLLFFLKERKIILGREINCLSHQLRERAKIEREEK